MQSLGDPEGQGRLGKALKLCPGSTSFKRAGQREEGEGQRRQGLTGGLLCPAKEVTGQHLGDGEPLKGHDMTRCGCEDVGGG